jgi:hypothetical protein
MVAAAVVALPLPVLTEGWTAEKDFKVVGAISAPVTREIEPVGPHFLAHARRKRHKRTFSEDERIQAQENVKKVEDDDSSEISEPEDPVMLQRDAKDWKVRFLPFPQFRESPHICGSETRYGLRDVGVYMFMTGADINSRTKTITPSSAFPSTGSKRRKSRSSGPTVRRC